MSGSAEETGVEAGEYVDDGGRIDARGVVSLILASTVLAWFGGAMGVMDSIFAKLADIYTIPIDGMVDAGVEAFSGQSEALETAWVTASETVVAGDFGLLSFAVGLVVVLAFFAVVRAFVRRVTEGI